MLTSKMCDRGFLIAVFNITSVEVIKQRQQQQNKTTTKQNKKQTKKQNKTKTLAFKTRT